MEFLLNRYRNLTVLLVVIAAQLLLIAYQVKTNKDVPLIRVWAVTVVTPIEQVLEVVRRNTWVFVEDYFVLWHTRSQNDQLQREVGRLKLENQYLKTELSSADRAQALTVFQARSPSKTVAARIIGNSTGANSKAVFVDRGSASGIEAGMAVVTPDGIVGKVVAAYPTASLVLLITDPTFAAGVISQKNRVHGTLKGQGRDRAVQIEYIQNEERVDPGEWFYASGDDRVFPKGFPVGQVTAVRNGRSAKEVYVTPSGFQNGLEEVLIVLDAKHQVIPDVEVASPGYKLLPAPPPVESAAVSGSPAQPGLKTDADRLKDQYRQLGVEEKHPYGEGGLGEKPLDFTKLPPLRGPEGNKPATPAPGTAAANAKGAAAGARPGPAGVLPGIEASQPAVEGRPAVSDKTTPAAPLAAPSSVAVKPKPQPSGPLLITDPTDADPSEATPPAAPPKPAPNRRPAVVVDSNTEILPDAPPPKRKAPKQAAAPATPPPQ
ncbi:MAG: rod shape-determining protein MreC [Bryobacteraceae bacterium]